jgi:hypothetical protein
MTPRHFQTITIVGVVALVLIISTVLAAVASAGILDAWIQRGGGSVNTMVPGFTYAAATVMKVTLLESAVLLLGAIVAWFHDRNSLDSVPVFGLLSLLAQPLTIFVGAVLVLVFQERYADVAHILIRSSAASRAAVLGMMGLLGLGFAVGILSFIRRERPLMVPAVAIVSDFALILLFRYFEFYKLGFDQDRWAE